MATTDNRELIGRLLILLRDGLQPVIERVLTPLTPPNRQWVALLEERDRVAGRTSRYASNDLQTLLVAMTGRLGSLGFPLTPVLGSRANSLLPEELRKVRNDWAQMAAFNDADTDRALDSGARLLRALGAEEAGGLVRLHCAAGRLIGTHSGCEHVRERLVVERSREGLVGVRSNRMARGVAAKSPTSRRVTSCGS